MATETIQSTPFIEPESAPITGELQPPTAPVRAPQEVPAVLAPQPSPPGSLFKNLSESFMGAVLSGLAGSPTPKVGIDNDPNSPTYGQEITIPVPPMSTAEKLKRVAANALAGLAAGAQAPQLESPGATALGALGTGAQAVIGRDIALQQEQRKLAREEFEAQQKALFQKAQIANLNTVTLANAMKTIQSGMQPSFEHNQAIASALEKANIPVRYMDAQEYMKQAEANPQMTTDYAFRPVRIVPALTSDGQPVLNDDGTPKMITEGFLVPHAEAGKIEITPELEREYHTYGKAGGAINVESVKAGDTIPYNNFVAMITAIEKGKGASLEAKPELIIADGQLKRKNPISGELSEPSETEKLEYEQKLANIAYTKMLTKRAGEPKAPTGGLEGLTEEEIDALADAVYNNQINIAQIASLRNDQRMKLAAAVLRRHPDWDQKTYTTAINTLRDFTIGKSGQNIVRFNTAIMHLDQLAEAAKALETNDIQTVNRIANLLSQELGEEVVPNYEAIRTAVAGELASVYKGIGATDQEIASVEKAINAAQSPKQAEGVVRNILELMAGRLTSLYNQFISGTKRTPEQEGINIVSPEGAAVYQKWGIDPLAKRTAATERVLVEINGRRGYIPRTQVDRFMTENPGARIIR